MVPESTEHLDLRTALYLVLRRVFDATAWIGSDQFVYFHAGDPSRVLAPDIFVRRGGPNASFSSWKVWERGTPELAIEIVSESDASSAEWEKKLEKYQALGVLELARFEAGATPALRVWDLIDGELLERRLNGSRATSAVLGLDLVAVGAALRLEKDGRVLPTPDELARAESIRADQAARRAQVEAERAQAEAARARAEAERARAEAERAQAEAERAERLRARLIAAGIDPEE